MNTLSIDRLSQVVARRMQERRLPDAVTFELTYGCNCRCLHCYNPTHRALPQELTTSEVCAILDQIADLGVLHIHFSGGEPLVRPDAFDIFVHAKRRGLLLNLLTNATKITAPVAERLAQLGFVMVNVSIYGATAATYERVTGQPGSFAQFLQGLDHLVRTRLPVTVRMPLLSVNVEEREAARALAESRGFKFQYGMDLIARTDGNPAPLRYRLAPADKLRVGRAIKLLPMPLTPTDCRLDGESFINCACGRSRFAVTPYGEMNLCVGFPIPKYDLRTGTVTEGWEVLKRTVDGARPTERYACPSCEVRAYCRQGRNDAWLETGEMSACLPHYREWATLERNVHESRNA